MRSLKVSDVVGIINKKFPFACAEEWDNVGLQVGDPAGEVTRIMVALDPLPEVLDQALESGCQLLITHHPLIFTPLRQVTSATVAGRLVLRAASSGLALIAMHTNYDIAVDGLNDLLAQRLGVQETRPLKVTEQDQLVKLVVFVPADHLESVRQALFEHAAAIGNYRDCSFSAPGEGTFLPEAGAQPAIGAVGRLEKVSEQRLELLLHKADLPRAIRTLLAVHPYEEPAFDCYPLLNQGATRGVGRIGRLAEPCRLEEYARLVCQRLGCKTVRTVGAADRVVRKVALCSGSGGSLLRDALRAGADLLVTGDLKYHEAREAEAAGMALLDAGHFGTEIIMVEALCEMLRNVVAAQGYDVEIVRADREQEPFAVHQS